ncbi:MAG: AURKAIP1/COX24 domain-containing protein [Deltaproteobacteria bacterium]|nr:AURKAIP1/COX24 domain-containing protein [Desulfobacterales bacterium]MDO9124143.1 AURKAIP1/COX24 domain-containing protein [Deltaproteobacteria bacterium]MDP3017012.1 AURKAIP1/COX24 domain-containing protein [Deltaproteobacteria bacterium]
MGSVVKKRRKKMAKHKHEKRLDRDRHKKKK